MHTAEVNAVSITVPEASFMWTECWHFYVHILVDCVVIIALCDGCFCGQIVRGVQKLYASHTRESAKSRTLMTRMMGNPSRPATRQKWVSAHRVWLDRVCSALSGSVTVTGHFHTSSVVWNTDETMMYETVMKEENPWVSWIELEMGSENYDLGLHFLLHVIGTLPHGCLPNPQHLPLHLPRTTQSLFFHNRIRACLSFLIFSPCSTQHHQVVSHYFMVCICLFVLRLCCGSHWQTSVLSFTGSTAVISDSNTDHSVHHLTHFCLSDES